MKLSFNAEDASEKAEIPSGVYDFRITNVEERVFSTGTEGVTITLDVFLSDRIIKVYENMYYTRKALWKFRDLCTTVGVEFRDGLDSEDLIGKSGSAFFGRDKGDKFLKVQEFIKDGASKSDKANPPSVTDDEVPF